jgi:hypothetical protein
MAIFWRWFLRKNARRKKGGVAMVVVLEIFSEV